MFSDKRDEKKTTGTTRGNARENSQYRLVHIWMVFPFREVGFEIIPSRNGAIFFSNFHRYARIYPSF